MDFSEIEYAISKFSGDSQIQTVQNFFNDFEELMQTVNDDNHFKLLSLRRSLTGTARLFLTTTSALNYSQLKKELIKEFDVFISHHDVNKMLAQRQWQRREESMHCYVLTMQAIAKQSDIEEAEVVDFIIDGIGNSAVNINLLASARTIEELKVLIKRYQYRYLTSATGRDSKVVAVTRVAPTRHTMPKQTAEKDPILCFNCSQTGHIKPNCPYPLRQNGSCFKCWRMGHDHRSCPNPRKILKKVDSNAEIRNAVQVAAFKEVDESEDPSNVIAALNLSG